jgi:predicted transcriptional regulator
MVKVIKELFENVSTMGDIGIFLLGGAVAVYALLQIWSFVEKKIKGSSKGNDLVKELQNIKNDLSSIEKKLEGIDEVRSKVDKLYNWHDKEDATGRKVWYVQYSVKDIINDVLEGVETMMNVVDAMVEELENLETQINQIDNEIKERRD